MKEEIETNKQEGDGEEGRKKWDWTKEERASNFGNVWSGQPKRAHIAALHGWTLRQGKYALRHLKPSVMLVLEQGAFSVRLVVELSIFMEIFRGFVSHSERSILKTVY
jgi:hypothetical protein